MSETVEMLSKEQAIALIGGPREEVHCFVQLGAGMFVGADWTWKEFEKALDRAEKCVEAGANAKQMKHPLALFVDGRWKFFEALSKAEGTPD